MSQRIRNIALFAEMGTGKTKTTIDILRWKYFRNGIMKTLILSPVVTLHNWKREFARHSDVPQHMITVLDKATKKIPMMDKAVMDNVTKEYSKKHIVIVNYEALQSPQFFARLQQWNPEVIICDESHLLKNPKSKRGKMVQALADRAQFKYILTGTPILNNSLDIFQQFRILDGGETFGKNYGTFRSKYFVDENAAWSGKTGGFAKYVERPEAFNELHGLIYRKAIRVLKSECLDLPPLIEQTLEVPLSTEQQKLYNEMKRDYITFVKDLLDEGKTKAVVAQIAATKALRLQQIVSGFVKAEDGSIIETASNPRLDILGDLLSELTPNHKVIVWCSFKHNYKQIGKLCEKLKIPHVFITGDQSTQEKQESIDAFANERSVRVVIANRRAGGIGVSLVAASYSIIFSRNFSLGEELQSTARNHRGGSEIHKKIVKIDLCSPGTVDEQVMKALKNKQRISDQLIDWIKE